MQEERIVIVDINDNVIGSKDRSMITYNDIYRVSSLWIINDKSELLIQKRPSWKKNHPNLWTESAVGTVAEGEDYNTNLIKEAKEELGIDLNPDRLKFIKSEYSTDNETFQIYGGISIYEYNEETFNINKDEVPEIRWTPFNKLNNMNNNSIDDIEFVPDFDRLWSIVYLNLNTNINE